MTDSDRMLTRFTRRSAAGVFVLLGLACAAIYLATLTDVHTFDALSYVTSVEQKPWTEVFHPHHLAYGPLGVLALATGRLLGVGGAAVPMQVINALAGAGGVVLFALLVRERTRRLDLALVLALLLGGSYAYWYYAVEIEVYTVAVVFLILSLMALFRLLDTPDRRWAIWLGVAQGLAILFHQTNVLLCVPVAVSFAALLRQSGRSVVPLIFWYAGSLALIVGVPYVWVMFGVSGFRTVGAVEAWLLEYARTGWWGGPITATKWELLGKGLSETWLAWGGGWVLVALLAVGAWYRRGLVGAGVQTLVLVAWLLSYGGFFLWWEPDNIEFWIASLPPALLLLGLALRRSRPWHVSTWLLLGLGIALFWANGQAIARRGDATTDLQRTITSALAGQSVPADLLLIPDGLQELYLPYYAQRQNFLSINQALFDAGNDWQAACNTIRSRIETSRHAGATAIIADEVLRPPALVLNRHRLAQVDVDACFAVYASELVALPMPYGTPDYWRLPGAGELRERGWSFARSAEGWLALNVRDVRWQGGWQFVPASDPALLGPLVEIDTRRYQTLEVTLANGTSATEAQLFFVGPDDAVSETNSVRFAIAPQSPQTTYTVPLTDAPGWEGTIYRLRLDPVAVGDGGAITLVQIRLIPAGE